MPKLTDEQLIREVEARESSSYGINDAKLSDDRAKAFKYYNGEYFGNELEGRSQVISRDVLDCVEAALPQLLKVFVAGDEVVRFEPRGPEDEEAAEQETCAVNYYAMEKNDGFAIFYTWFKDALLSKNGYVKVWWEEEDETETETYQGLTDDQMTLMLQDERIEVIEHTAIPDEQDAQQKQEALQQLQAQQNPQAQQQIQQILAQPPAMLHDVKISITESKGCIKIDNVAPEDMLVGVDTKTTNLQFSSFVQHRALMFEEEITEQGWKLPDNAAPGNDSSQWQESLSRNLYNEQDEYTQIEQYLVKDTYIRINGELLRLVIIGNEIVHREDAEIIPFACITPHIMPHRHIGMSYADLTMDIQLQKSTLLRGMFDAQYLANQPRFGISDRVNLDDMLTSRPGGVVRVDGDPGGNIMPLVTPTFPQSSFSLIEYMDSANTKRTGITAYDQGLDADALNKTATGAKIIENNSQKRVELVARTFANTGVKELFILIHRLVRKYNTRPDIIRLRKEWVTVDPREWKERKNMTVIVGLGTGNKDQQLMHLMTILQAQREGLQIGVTTPKNIFNALTKLTQNAGFKSPEEFWTDPGDGPAKPPQDPKIALKKMELEADQQRFQAETITNQQQAEKDSQLEIQKFQAEAAIDQQKADRVWQQEQLRSQNDVAIEKEKIAAQMALERYKAELQAQTQLQIAQLNAEVQAQQMERQYAMDQQQAAVDMKKHEDTIAAANRPRKVIRDSNNRIDGVQ